MCPQLVVRQPQPQLPFPLKSVPPTSVAIMTHVEDIHYVKPRYVPIVQTSWSNLLGVKFCLVFFHKLRNSSKHYLKMLVAVSLH